MSSANARGMAIADAAPIAILRAKVIDVAGSPSLLRHPLLVRNFAEEDFPWTQWSEPHSPRLGAAALTGAPTLQFALPVPSCLYAGRQKPSSAAILPGSA